MAEYINTASLDFDTIKADIIARFKSNDTFKDYDFTGSALNVLIDVLAYNTHYNALTANLAINEMFLDSAVKRDSVVSIAKSLGYTPRSTRAATASVDLTITDNTTDAPDSISLPSFTPFNSKAGNTSFTFYNTNSIVAGRSSAGTYTYSGVEIKEGVLIQQSFTASGSTGTSYESFDLSNIEIDTTTIRVNVDNIAWSNVSSLDAVTSITDKTQVYFVEESRGGKHRIHFGNGVLGQRLEGGQTVSVSYLKTAAAAANNISLFNPGALINNKYSLVISNVNKSVNGSVIEGIDEVRENASNYYGAQNRAITTSDYEAIIRNNFSNISSLTVWGGEDNIPADFGSVYISIRPTVGTTLSSLTKTSIVNSLRSNYNVVSIRPVIVDPVITKINIKTLALFDESKLTSTANELQSQIFNLFQTWNDTYVGEFISPFRISTANTEIVNLDPAITSANTRITLSRELTSDDTGILPSYTINFGNRIYNPHVGFNADNGGVVSSNGFTLPGETVEVAFDDDGAGNIRLFSTATGVKAYRQGSFGTVDYTTGIVTLNALTFTPNQTIRLTVAPESYDVLASRNNILVVEENQTLSTVNVVSSTNTSLINTLDTSRGI